MAGTDSPPPFAVRFRYREDATAASVYQLALAFAGQVDSLIDQPDLARAHVRSHLYRNATSIALALGRAANEPARSERRRLYRLARPLALECVTLLDLIGQRAAADRVLIDSARTRVTTLVDKLEHLAAR